MTLDNTTIWNESAKAGVLFGAVSVACLALKELAGISGINFLVQAATIILWAVEFFGCIWLMKEIMLRFKDKYENVKIEDTYKLGRRAALLSGLILSSAEALLIMKMPPESMDQVVDQITASMNLLASEKDTLDSMIGKLPLYTFFFQWLYCFLYGSVLSSIMSRYIFLQKLFGSFPPKDDNTPDNQ